MSNFETFLDLDIDLNVNDNSNLNKKSSTQETLEGIDLKSFYTKKDADNLGHIGSMPGIDHSQDTKMVDEKLIQDPEEVDLNLPPQPELDQE